MEMIILTPKFLKKFYPLTLFSDDDLNDLIRKTRVDNFSRMEIIFKQGSVDEDMIFLMLGGIQLKSDDGVGFTLDSEAEQAAYPIANIKPRKFSAYVVTETASVARIPTKDIEDLLARQSKTKTAKSVVQHNPGRVLDSDWMMAMKRTPLFQKLQDEFISQLFQVMDEKTYKTGDKVIRQGEPGDYFYLIKEGRCNISRFNGKIDVDLAMIGPTESFGEEALLTKSDRNATVTMLTDGTLMRISKKDFEQFMYQPVVHWIAPTEAAKLLKNGAVPVDVRQSTATQKALKNAIKIPFLSLRNELNKLDKDKSYLILCDDSREGAVASYLFSKFGLDGYILRNQKD
jgi:signal-transduction protein with cAMP-binding, CBS, and nucleotidyltransferase domain